MYMKNFLDKCASAYYTGSPLISDEEYDSLAEQYNHYVVGHTVCDGYPHIFPMYSLQKTFDIKDSPKYDYIYAATPKLDGAAVSITYVSGTLALALTRGDGSLGRGITKKLASLVETDIPLPSIYQITGEVVAPKSIPNSRNYVSGSLGLKDDDEGFETFLERDLKFFAYNIQPTPNGVNTQSEMFKYLRDLGFNTVDQADTSVYPTDGQVFKVDNISRFEELGYTQHHPRGAFALKEKKKGVITTLVDVKWQVGKSGIVSPVAILDPVVIEGATVSRATLHNIEYIEALELEIGCAVEVIRSGDIIPRIVRKVNPDVEK